MLQIIDRRWKPEGPLNLAIVDQSRSVFGECGPVVQTFTSMRTAQRALKEIPHGRIVRLKKGIVVTPGLHLVGQVHLETKKDSRWL